ncbi:hypothetical protein MXB_341 [Myxobolus squamalis]|nr:hypothetical protein MXB_341 [Myxobolus squamalis]
MDSVNMVVQSNSRMDGEMSLFQDHKVNEIEIAIDKEGNKKYSDVHLNI